MGESRTWAGLRPLLVRRPTSCAIVKVVAFGESVVALLDDARLAVRRRGDDEFTPLDAHATDVACDARRLLWIDPRGCLYESATIPLEPAKIDLPERMRSVNASPFGVLLIAERGRLYAAGRMPQIDVDSPHPIPVPFFKDRSAEAASVGERFAAAILRRAPEEDTFVESDEAMLSTSSSSSVQESTFIENFLPKQLLENVSNLTTELVRNVSRHVSAGSAETAPPTVSSGSTSSSRSGGRRRAVDSGRRLLTVDVWTWGSNECGQLGAGDAVARSKPALVAKLSQLGVHRITCGRSHCVALTLDGRAHFWGGNLWRQISSEPIDSYTAPFHFTSDRIWDVACGDDHTLLSTHGGSLLYLGKHDDGFTKDGFASLVESSDRRVRVTASRDITHARFNACSERTLRDLAAEQQFLEETTSVHQMLIKPLLKKTASFADCKFYDALCGNYAEVMYFTAVNVMSLWKYAEYVLKASEVNIVQNFDQFISLYEKYLTSLCDIISIGGFSLVSLNVDVPKTLQNMFADKLPTSSVKNSKKAAAEAVISYSLTNPLSRLNVYKCIIQSMLQNAESAAPMISKLDELLEDYEKRKREAETTRSFWEGLGRQHLDALRSPNRRVVRDSKTHSLSLPHSGRFSSHWFILLNDAFVHINGGAYHVHKLATLWVEPIGDNDATQNSILLTAPEETMTLTAPTYQEKTEWLHALQNTIKIRLRKQESTQMPMVRTAVYTFSSKSQLYKDAKYSGRWLNGKMHGYGIIEWPDGKIYQGLFQNNQLYGFGKMEIPNIGTYEGQWKDNLQNGYGVMKYYSGDVYEGYFQDGLAHGYGVRKQGDFTTAAATVYMGDWSQGMRQGYGIMDDIGKGEKYLGAWSENKKCGCGVIVTLDGIYYEGIFVNDMLTGRGVMIFEDGTHYEGEFKSAGVFSGKGTLTFSSGDKIEGTLSGAWIDGVKIHNATLRLNISNPTTSLNPKPNSFGKLCVPPDNKWNGLFRQYFSQIGIPDSVLTPTRNHFLSVYPDVNNKTIWQNIAIALSQLTKDNHKGSFPVLKNPTTKSDVDQLNLIPNYGQSSLTEESLDDVKKYLLQASESSVHPLGLLVNGISASFCTTYGGVRVHPLLLSHAIDELKSLFLRLYHVIRILFPALPKPGEYSILNNDADKSNKENEHLVSISSIVQPLLLPRVHSSLHVLYALHHQREDVDYWKRLLNWNRQTDVTLMSFLGIHQKFWVKHVSQGSSAPISPVKEQLYSDAVNMLQQLKTTFSPLEKLLVIKNTFEQMTTIVQMQLGLTYQWTMDELFPLFHFVVVRARILQLGSEIHFIEDFMEPCMQNGELGIMFTTLKACYYQILQEKVNICD